MFPVLYYTLVFALLYIAYNSARKEIVSRFVWFRIYSCLLLAATLLGIRFVVSDWYTHYLQYEELSGGFNIMLMNEFLWMQLERLFAYFHASFYTFMTFVYLGEFVLILHGVRHIDRSLLPLSSLMVLLLIPGMSNTIRQMLAVSIFIYSIHFIYEKKFWHFFVLYIIGVNIHYSLLLYLPVYWLLQRGGKGAIGLQLFFYAFCLSPLANYLSQFILNYVGVAQALGLYQTFDGSYGLDEIEYNTGLGKISHVLQMIVIIICSNRIKKEAPCYKVIYPLFFICTCLQDSFGAAGWFVGRLFYYGTALSLFTIPITCSFLVKQGQIQKLIAYTIILTLVAGFVFNCFSDFFAGLTPLRFYWQDSESLIYQYYSSN